MQGWHILVAEDEPLVALDLELGLGDAGATVLGPFKRCEDAMRDAGAASLHAAVLDVNLIDGNCEALAVRLRELAVPFVLHTGEWRAEGEVVNRIGAPVVSKPAPISAIVNALLLLKPRPEAAAD